MDGLIHELKRRNVFRVAVAYMILGWVVMQVVDIVVPALFLPDWVPTFFLLAGIIGFPFALLFAWAFELTPSGLKRAHDVTPEDSIASQTSRRLEHFVVVLLVIAVGFFAWDKFGAGTDPETALTASAPVASLPEPASPAPARKSIAVLPFVNMSDDKDYFADGLSEEILNLLARNRALKVIGRTSSFAFKGRTGDLREIGRTLGVSTILEGSVRKSGNMIRITAQLNEVQEGSHLWSETYDRELTDIFAIQDEVAAAIIDALQVHLGDTAIATRGRPTENMLAYEKFLTAKALWSSGQGRRALELLQEVVALDPTFAEAWEQLSLTFWNSGVEVLAAEDARAGCFSAATRALDLDPSLVLVAALAASCDTENWSWPREIAALETAVRQLPNDTGALLSLFFDYLEAGYVAEALALAERLVVIEPLGANIHDRIGNALRASGRVEEARAAWQRAMELGSAYSARSVFMDYMISGEIDAAIVAHELAMRMSGEDPAGSADRIRAAADPVTGRQALLDWLQTVPDSNFWKEMSWRYFLAFRQWDDLFAAINAYNAVATTWSGADEVMFHITIFRDSGITADPRYVAAMTDIGAVEAWEVRGPPDFCSKDTGAWVCE